jgi:hypothetical protein
VDGPNLYAYVGNSPIAHVDPNGENAAVIVILLTAFDVGVISQVSLEYQSMFMLDPDAVRAELQSNARAMKALKRIIGDPTEYTFENQQMSAVAYLGRDAAKYNSDNACPGRVRARTYFESWRNVLGYPSGLTEGATAANMRKLNTPGKQQLMAEAALFRLEAYESFLNRHK